ncbi:MAG: YggS family pyridoxal phosphate-dependent enzyme [Acidobacteria bacterium]|nr:YggS family pyridoxal phosphate-dependent enzyme [Acidobacteriota bacterium]
MSEGSDIGQRLARIRRRIDEACGRAGRDPAEVTLVGVSKLQPLERLLEAFEAGLRVFGENRVQEAEAKRPHLPAEADFHLIGPLQTNKAKKAVEIFSTVHSVDRLKIARHLDREATVRAEPLPCFLEVNLGAEESKHGFSPTGLLAALDELAALEHLRVVGLMAIPPQEPPANAPASASGDDAEVARSWFRRLVALRDQVVATPGWSGARALSMGMSDDFEVAIEEGATHVRVGTALFGPRPAPGATP